MDSCRRAQGKKKLEVVSEIVQNGGKVHVPIWTLLHWFDYGRRGPIVIGGIGSVLEECQLETRPDFADLALGVHTIVEFRGLPTPDPSPKEE